MNDCELYDERIFRESLIIDKKPVVKNANSGKLNRIVTLFVIFLSGKLLSKNTTSNIMKWMFYLSILCLGCIFLSMKSFSAGIEVNNAQKELDDIKARHFKLKTEVYSRSTYHEIIRQVNERNLNLELPTTPPYCY